MANFDSAHLYVQWGGKLPGNESWSCGFRMRRKTGAAVIADGATLLPNVAAAISAFHTRDKTNLGSGAKLSFVKCNAIGVEGRYLDGSGSNQAIFADLPGAGTSAQTFPNQVALAVTLTTGFTRGAAHKGRFYLPLFNSTLGTDGLIPATNAQLVSESVDTLISDVNAVDANFEMAIFSRRPSGPGNRRVTGNLVGRALDTQRRRRRALVENYV
jgi:hypothetical protein